MNYLVATNENQHKFTDFGYFWRKFRVICAIARLAPKKNTQNTAKNWKSKNMFDFWNAILR